MNELTVEQAAHLAEEAGFFGTDSFVSAFKEQEGRLPKKVNGSYARAVLLGETENDYVFTSDVYEETPLESELLIGIPFYLFVDKFSGLRPMPVSILDFDANEIVKRAPAY